MEHYFGAHTIDTGGIHMAARRAGNADMRAMQLFTAIPKYYGDKVSIRAERVTRFKEALAADGPVLVDVRVTAEENCYPMIPAGQAARDMVG